MTTHAIHGTTSAIMRRYILNSRVLHREGVVDCALFFVGIDTVKEVMLKEGDGLCLTMGGKGSIATLCWKKSNLGKIDSSSHGPDR